MAESDLHSYKNLAAFFYRALKPGVRPIDPNANALLSPADGKVLQFGMIEHGEVEQVKGMTYSLDALLGAEPPGTKAAVDKIPSETCESAKVDGQDVIMADEEFARVNGISYSLPNLFSGPQNQDRGPSMDASTTPKPSSEVLSDSSSKPLLPPQIETPTALYYIVVYLAPGDYHRFHSPTSWVVEKRRHFAGELYSVSPYLQRILPGLFTINERVVLLGRWGWGFFSLIGIGATNVGAIRINFDHELRTNSLNADTAGGRAAADAARKGEPYSGFAEAIYGGVGKSFAGYSCARGEELGGFRLGSSSKSSHPHLVSASHI